MFLVQRPLLFLLQSGRRGISRCTSLGSSSGSSGTPTDEGKTPKEKNKRSSISRQKTPIGKLEELDEGRHPFQEKEPLEKHPGGVNPVTGEIGGPAGPEPTRYGDWERKGRVTDF